MAIIIDVSDEDIKALRKQKENGTALSPIENAILQQAETEMKVPTHIYKYKIQYIANSFVIDVESYPIHNITDKWITYRIPRLDKLYDTKIIRKVYKGNMDKLGGYIKGQMWSLDKNAKRKFIELSIEEHKKQLNKAMKQHSANKDKIDSHQNLIKMFEYRLKDMKN